MDSREPLLISLLRSLFKLNSKVVIGHPLQVFQDHTIKTVSNYSKIIPYLEKVIKL